MELLPKWVLADTNPAIYDCESSTAITMVAKLHAKMQELINEYNSFADSWNKSIEEFTNATNENNTTFAVALRQEFQDFIDVINLKVQAIEQEYNTNLETITNTLNGYTNEILNSIAIDTTVGDVFKDFNVTINGKKSTVSIPRYSTTVTQDASGNYYIGVAGDDDTYNSIDLTREVKNITKTFDTALFTANQERLKELVSDLKIFNLNSGAGDTRAYVKLCDVEWYNETCPINNNTASQYGKGVAELDICIHGEVAHDVAVYTAYPVIRNLPVDMPTYVDDNGYDNSMFYYQLENTDADFFTDVFEKMWLSAMKYTAYGWSAGWEGRTLYKNITPIGQYFLTLYNK